MASIGGTSFSIWQGVVDAPMGMELAPIVRAGVDGVALKQVAIRPKPFDIRTMSDPTSASELQTLKETLRALKGTLVQVVDALGNSHSQVAVLDVAFESEGQAAAIVGGLLGGPFYLWCRWTLLCTAVPAA